MINALDGWVLSNHTIENKDEFRIMLRETLDYDNLETGSVDREESELMMFIDEYRKAGNFKAVCSHTNHLVEYYLKQERFDSAIEMVDENISHLVTMDLEDEEVKWYLFIARVLKAEILMGNNNPEDSGKEIENAFEIIPDNISLWKLGVGTRRDYYERSMKLRNYVK